MCRLGFRNRRSYAWDQAINPYQVQPDGTVGGPNFSKCEAVITINPDTLRLCESIEGELAGAITTVDGQGMGDVEVQLTGEITDIQFTNAAGEYQFDDLYEGYAYEVRPFYDLDHRNGVTTLDLIIMIKHILSIEPIESPYIRIAADANQSNTITTLDIIQFRKLILGIQNRLPQNTSWRFVDANYAFPGESDPFQESFPEAFVVKNLDGQLEDVNFMAIKIGDLNQSVQTGNFNGYEVETRSAPTAFLEIPNQTINRGATMDVPVYLPDFIDMEGFQFGLSVDPKDLNIVDIQPGLLSEANLGLNHLDRGIITASWFTNREGVEGSNTPLFTLTLQADRNTSMTEAISIHSNITTSEYYQFGDYQIGDLDLQFSDTQEALSFKVYPNPLIEEANLSIWSVTETTKVLIVRDVLGRRVYQQELELQVGRNEFNFNAIDWPNGLLFFEIDEKVIQLIKLE